jgi:hypothetical protein
MSGYPDAIEPSRNEDGFPLEAVQMISVRVKPDGKLSAGKPDGNPCRAGRAR